MATRLVLNTLPGADEEDKEGSLVIEVDHSFEDVMDKVVPLAQPTSAIEHRGTLIYTKTDGKRVMVHPHSVQVVEEL